MIRKINGTAKNTNILKKHIISSENMCITLLVFTSESINKIVGGELYFKAENLQKVGAFKFRGACNAVFSLTESEAAKGVVTHSSGKPCSCTCPCGKTSGNTCTHCNARKCPGYKKESRCRIWSPHYFLQTNPRSKRKHNLKDY